jgi:hypothetical protein
MPITISGSTGIAGVDGSASTPAVQGTDTNTGIVFPAADTVAVATSLKALTTARSSSTLLRPFKNYRLRLPHWKQNNETRTHHNNFSGFLIV